MVNLFTFILDQRAKEEAAIRQAEEAARDQHDAGTPSREEAGKFPLNYSLNTFMMNCATHKLTDFKIHLSR